MPKVTISSSKGLVQTSGSGFSVSDVELVRSNETVTPTSGAYYDIECRADVTDDLDRTYFVIYAQDGASYGIWIDTTTAPSLIPGDLVTLDTDNQVEVTTIAVNNTAAQVAAAIVLAINGDATALYDFEAVDNGGGTLTVYVLFTGAMTTTTATLPAAAARAAEVLTLTDGSDATEAIDASIECSYLAVGNSDAAVELASLLADGSVVGQRKNLIFAGHATGEVNVGGNFSSGGSAASLLSLATSTNPGVAMLVWNGSAWTVVHNVNVDAT